MGVKLAGWSVLILTGSLFAVMAQPPKKATSKTSKLRLPAIRIRLLIFDNSFRLHMAAFF
jgi:hypothetical protein